MNNTSVAREKYGCMECRRIDLYMVRDEVWMTAVPNYFRLRPSRRREDLLTNLCLRCLEKRLGRPLTLQDFTDTEVNDPIRFGWDMALRARVRVINDLDMQIELDVTHQRESGDFEIRIRRVLG